MAEDEEKLLEFHEMGLDDRLLKAIAKLGWASPTLIQEKAIPLALEGKDILSRARTGSGKTAAYAIPVIQNILRSKQMTTEQQISTLVMTPSKELCSQAQRNITDLCSSCSREVRSVDIFGQVALHAQKPLLREKPDIVIGTPSRVLAHLQAGNMTLKKSLQMLVIDEADLIFSFGYETDIKAVMSHLPQIYQAFLMSATLSEEVKSLKKLILHNPVILKLDESQLPESTQLTQYHIKCEDSEKFVLIYALFKLRLIRGKSIIFVNTVDGCYRLKLYLEQFQIRSCVLNSELPVNSRCHIVTQFNEGLYDILIAADETVLDTKVPVAMATDNKDAVKKKAGKSGRFKKGASRDHESGVSRGIDFYNISNVLNFDFPPDTNSYIHRVGRTARGSNQGTALSFVTRKEMQRLSAVEKTLAETHPDGESIFKPYLFKMQEIDGFRYRSQDALRAVTKTAVKEARLKEIKQEILNSEHLKTYFEDNPRDLQLLRHDKHVNTAKVQEHLRNVPDYLVPTSLKNVQNSNWEQNQSEKRGQKSARGRQQRKRPAMDPLKTFRFTGLSKKKRK